MRTAWKRVKPSERVIYRAVRNRYMGNLTNQEFDIIDLTMIENGIIERPIITQRLGVVDQTARKNLGDMAYCGLLHQLYDANDDHSGFNVYNDCCKYTLTDMAITEWHLALGEDPDEYQHEYRAYAAIRKAWEESNVHAVLPATSGDARPIALRPTTNRRYGEVWN